MGVTVTLHLNGVPVPVELDDDALASIAAAVAAKADSEPLPEFLTIPEAAELMRCSRQRIDDLLSARRLPRIKDGARTLIRRSDLNAYLTNNGRKRP
jgi:excisionase family DNA binding protein